MADQKVYNVGVIGYGLSAKVFHIPLIAALPSLRLSAIVQRSPTADSNAPQDHPSIAHYTDASQLFHDQDIDIIAVTTPPNTHYDFTLQALQSGKHVMVEKPFVPTSQQAAELAAAARTANRLICVYQNRRWDSDFLTFRSLYADGAGELGRIVEFETHFDRYKPERPRTWKGELGMADAGGVVYDLGSHLIDQVYVTFGLPRSVTAIFSNQRADGADEPDSVTILLQYPGGLVCTAKAGVVSIESEQLRFWVRGTGGTYKKYHLDVQEDQLKAGAKPTDANFGVEGEERAGVLTTLVGGTPVARAQPNVKPVTYLGIYERFVEAIRAGDASKVPVKAEEAADVLRIIEAARRSAKEGRTVEL